MYTFFVLGLVPGTNFQITFTMWLEFVEALLLAFGLYVLGRRLIRAGRQGLLETAPISAVLPAKLRHR